MAYKNIDGQTLRAMNAAGATDAEISKALGCSRLGVTLYRHRHGIPAANPPHARRKLEDLTEAEFRRAMRNKSFEMAAARLGVSHKTVKRKAEREGWI